MIKEHSQMMMHQKTDERNKIQTYTAISQFHQAVSGALSGCLTRTLTQPFDVLKIRFQLQLEPLKTSKNSNILISSKYTSLLQASRLIYKEEGIKAFWKGHNSGQMMSITYALIQFWSYEQIRLKGSQTTWFKDHTHVSNFVSGGLAGCIATTISMPFDIVRTRVIAQDHNVPYRNVMNTLSVILRDEGVRGLFRGLVPTVVQIGPLVGCNFLFYRIINDFGLNLLHPSQQHLPAWYLLMSGGVAGTLSKVILYPLDFIKKRLQLQGFKHQRVTFGRNHTCNGAIDCIRVAMREEGAISFYKGVVPTLYKSGLTTALYFVLYDASMRFFEEM
ncbi:mitochondrial thiamine pyrophosphate carrier-like [Teleopsis dalmanni]|uniref:mitochondrial thiamine pyrophosphate carrier-like n=1 Tax=Teleopsis dalmanni TaxID=139649 RepID=UPI0018CF93B4|nr:mitochondrial thiamine pyrophosphate carrier-like [Teleopsis dalmanni]XP_037956575.1 mitochondrial thiamine pyrophosphate carrier-like [Teleopsis dalmanni]